MKETKPQKPSSTMWGLPSEGLPNEAGSTVSRMKGVTPIGGMKGVGPNPLGVGPLGLGRIGGKLLLKAITKSYY
jgi:hypothetical protein